MVVICVFVSQDNVWGSPLGAWDMEGRECRPYVDESTSAEEVVMELSALAVS